MEEIRNARAYMLQRKQRLEALITKRTHNLQYLRKFHEGEHFWMNIALMTKNELYEYADKHVPAQRTISYFYLGISLSKIYDSTIGLYNNKNTNVFEQYNDNDGGLSNTRAPSSPEVITKFVRNVIQLIEEFEYYFASSAMQSVKYVMAHTSPCMYPNLRLSITQNHINMKGEFSTEGDCGVSNSPGTQEASSYPKNSTSNPSLGANPLEQSNLAKPFLHKYQSEIVYEVLLTPHVPFELDYLEVFSSLCDVLILTYVTLHDATCYR